jgi:RNA polymerase sigma-32 factor
MPRLHDEDPGFRRYVLEVNRFPLLAREDELRLARRFRRRRDRAAARALVEAHLRDVVRIAAGYRGYGLRAADLVAEGNIGLLEAVLRFEPDRGLRFMTYAAYWIRAAILAHVLRHFSIVSLGSSPLASRLFFRLQRERARLTATLGEGDPSIEGALAARFSTSRERVRAMSGRLERHDVSLDMPRYGEDSGSSVERIRDPGVDQEELAERAERVETVRRAVAAIWRTLDERERQILSRRLLVEDDGESLASLGRRMGVSRERVRQLEERVKRKLRAALAPTARVA